MDLPSGKPIPGIPKKDEPKTPNALDAVKKVRS